MVGLDPQLIAPAGMGLTRCIFMVGIGGAGMSGIAEVLMGLGYTVIGSDQSESPVIDRLRSLGATVYRPLRGADQRGGCAGGIGGRPCR